MNITRFLLSTLTIAPLVAGACAADTATAQITVYGSPAYNAGTQTGYTNGWMPFVPGDGVNSSGGSIGVNEKRSGGIFVGYRAVRWDATGTATELGNLGLSTSGSTDAYAYAINDAGVAAGLSLKYDGAGVYKGPRAVRWDATGAATELGTLGLSTSGSTSATAFALNDAGIAAGRSEKYDGAGLNKGYRAVRWDAAGAATELGTLGLSTSGATFAEAYALNEAGIAAGYSQKYDGAGILKGVRAVRWDAVSGAATGLGTLGLSTSGSTSATAFALNDAGIAAGRSEKYDGAGSYKGLRAVRWDATGAALELGNLGLNSGGGTDAQAYALNDAGLAAGYSLKYESGVSKGNRAVRWDASGAALELGNLGLSTSGFTDAVAYALNDAGLVAGFSQKYDGAGTPLGTRAVVWGLDGVAIDLNDLLPTANDATGTWFLTEAQAIAENGWVSGRGFFTPTGGGGYTRHFTTQVQVGFGGAWTDATTGTLNGLWSNGAQWSTGTPAMGVGTATFDQSAAYTVTLDRNESTQAINVTAGSVTFATDGFNLGSTSGTTIATGAALNIGGGGTLGTYSGNITNNGSLAFDHSNASAYAGVISGSGGLTKTGAGTLTLSGTNSYTGGTTITGGTLSGNTLGAPGANSSFGAGSSVAISGGGTLEYTGAGDGFNQAISLGSGGGRISVTNAMSLNQVVSGTSLAKAGPGLLRFDAAMTYTGATIVEAGTLLLNDAERIANASALVVESGATFNMNGLAETVGSLAGAGSVTNNNAGLTVGGDNSSTTYSGTISGSSSLTKIGAGVQTLTGVNTYAGTNTISAGTLSGNSIANQGVDSAFGRGNFVMTDGGAIQYSGPSASTDRTVALGAGGGAIDVSNSSTSLTISGAVTGADLSKTGPGTLVLTGANTYTGTTTIAGGKLSGGSIDNTGVNTSFGAGNAFSISNGATLEYTGATASTNRSIALGIGSGAVSVSQSTAVLTASGTIGGTGGLTKQGAGTLILGSSANNYSGATTVAAGTLRSGGSNVIPDGSAVTVGSGATFDLTNFNETIGSLAGGGAVQLGSGNLSAGGNGASTQFDGVISGSGGLTKTGGGTMILTGANAYAGNTTINGGMLSGNTIANQGSNSAFGRGNFYDAISEPELIS